MGASEYPSKLISSVPNWDGSRQVARKRKTVLKSSWKMPHMDIKKTGVSSRFIFVLGLKWAVKVTLCMAAHGDPGCISAPPTSASPVHRQFLTKIIIKLKLVNNC